MSLLIRRYGLRSQTPDLFNESRHFLFDQIGSVEHYLVRAIFSNDSSTTRGEIFQVILHLAPGVSPIEFRLSGFAGSDFAGSREKMRIGRIPKELELNACWLERWKFSSSISENAAIRKRQMSSARSLLRVASGPGSALHMPSKRGTPTMSATFQSHAGGEKPECPPACAARTSSWVLVLEGRRAINKDDTGDVSRIVDDVVPDKHSPSRMTHQDNGADDAGP